MDIKVLFLAVGLAVFSDNCYCIDKDEYVNPYEKAFNKPDKFLSQMLSLFAQKKKYESPNEWAIALKASKSPIDWYINRPNEELRCNGIIHKVLFHRRLAVQFLAHKDYKNDKALHDILLNLLKIAPRACKQEDYSRFPMIFLQYQLCIKLMEENGILSVFSDKSFEPIFDAFAAIIASHFDIE